MKKILIGGSPCTFWSINQTPDKRETTCEGIGWELFRNYLIAYEKFKPDFFLYENNESISKEIQSQIEKELDVKLLHINSSKLSAQTRKRIYATNIDVDLESMQDLNLHVKDIVDYSYKNENLIDITKFRKEESIKNDNDRIIRIGEIGKGGQGERVYSLEGKSVTLCAKGGGRGAKTGLYLINDVVRKLNPIEAERLQCLPDNYTEGISNVNRYSCIGNGWTASVIEYILKYMDINKDEEIIVLSLYDGIATGRYVLDKLGYKNIKYFAYEIDKNAIKIALKNYPDIVECGDAFKIRENLDGLLINEIRFNYLDKYLNEKQKYQFFDFYLNLASNTLFSVDDLSNKLKITQELSSRIILYLRTHYEIASEFLYTCDNCNSVFMASSKIGDILYNNSKKPLICPLCKNHFKIIKEKVLIKYKKRNI